MNENNPTITLSLPLAAINVILNSLARAAYGEVYETVDLVRSQTAQQVKPPQGIGMQQAAEPGTAEG